MDWAATRRQPRLLVSDAHFEACAQTALDSILAKLPNLRLTSESHVTIYSFWLHITARTATLLAEQLRAQGVTVDRVISRAHRYDLYPSVAPRHHIPERRLLLQSLDGICRSPSRGLGNCKQRGPSTPGRYTLVTWALPTPDRRPTADVTHSPLSAVPILSQSRE